MSRIRFPLETGRLLIRPMTLDDAEDLHEVYSDPTTFRYIGMEPSRSIEETRERIADKARHQEEHGQAE